jgi:hypothetical protein
MGLYVDDAGEKGDSYTMCCDGDGRTIADAVINEPTRFDS